MKNILFLHQNFPGQFRHLAPHLSRQGWQVVGLGETGNIKRQTRLPNTQTLGYPHTPRQPHGHAYLRTVESHVRQGQSALRGLLILKRTFTPDIICAHPGWGEALFLREVFPNSKIINYCEFFYRADGADVGFDPEFPAPTLDALCRLRLRNTPHLLALDACDKGWAPSQWQARQLPAAYRHKIEVIHEGIDTDLVSPKPDAVFNYKGLKLTRADSVVTYVARNLEPYRGFHVFMRALPKILADNPKVRIIIVGGDAVSYGMHPKDAPHWRAKLLKEVGRKLDPSRVHFVGRLPYADYLALLQVSSAHVYLTYPFVLSWSLLEAMAAGCALIVSRTAPVEEVISHNENGLLVDFFDTAEIAGRVGEVLNHPQKYEAMRSKARETIVQRYDLRRVCLPRQVAMLAGMLEKMSSTETVPATENQMNTMGSN